MRRNIALALLALQALPLPVLAAGPPSPRTWSGQNSAITVARNVVVRDAAAFAQLWREHAAGSPRPAVDFGRFDLVAVFAGKRNTGGHSARIDAVKVERGAARVRVTLKAPPPDAMVTMALTSPWAAREVPKLPSQVRFEVRRDP